MKKVLAATILLVFALGATIASADEPLTPRYSRIVGVQLFAFYPTVFGYNCKDETTGRDVLFVSDEKVYGIVVSGTEKGSPAEKAGLQCGDVIVGANGIVVEEVKDLRAVINQARSNDPVSLIINQSSPGYTDLDGKVHVKYLRRVVIDVASIVDDEVERLAKLPALKNELAVDDGLGKALHVESESTFELLPGNEVRYSCTVTHQGVPDEMLVDSAYFSVLGSSELLLAIPRGGSKTFSFTASIDREGIPVQTEISMYVDRNIDPEKYMKYIDKYGGSVSRIKKSDAWHAWVHFVSVCWLPQAKARAVEAKKQNGSGVGR